MSKEDYRIKEDIDRMFMALEILEREMRRTSIIIDFPLNYITKITEEIKNGK